MTNPNVAAATDALRQESAIWADQSATLKALTATVEGLRWRNLPALPRYLSALDGGETPPRALEPLAPSTQVQERLMLGLRLDDPLPLADVEEPLLDAETRDSISTSRPQTLVAEIAEQTTEETPKPRAGKPGRVNQKRVRLAWLIAAAVGCALTDISEKAAGSSS